MANCVQCGEPATNNCESCVPKCTNCSNKCTTFLDTDCVFYNYNQPNKYSDFECLGIASNTSLTDILKAMDERLCTPFLVQDTNTVDLVISGNVLSANVRIDPASTVPYSIGPNGIKLDCCETAEVCSGIDYEIEYNLGDVTKAPNFYTVLNNSYFTKSQYLDNVLIADATSYTGGTFSYLKYMNFLTNSMAYAPGNAQSFNMPLQCCAKSIIDKQAQFVVELGILPLCKFTKSCVITTDRIEHSEKLKTPLNYNPQFDEPPYHNGWLYFPDYKVSSVIRKVHLDTREVITISGMKSASIQTFNGANGAYVVYPDLAGLFADTQEISNGEPVLYSATTRGVIIRIVRTSNDKCDERENWTTFVIAGANTNGDVVGTGDVARFTGLNSVKSMGYYNGAPILILSDRGNGKLKIAYYTGINKNVASNWVIATIPTDSLPVENGGNKVGFSNSQYANFNVDRLQKLIVTFYENAGRTIVAMNSFTGNVNIPSDYLVAANYTPHYAINCASASGASITTQNGSATSAQNIYFMSKVYKSGGPVNSYGYAYCEYSPSDSRTLPYLNYLYLHTNTAPLDPTKYRVSQLIGNNLTQPIANTGAMPGTANSTSYGICTVLLANLPKQIDLTESAFRVIDFNTNLVGPIVVGETNATFTQGDTAATDYMDTQYQFKITC